MIIAKEPVITDEELVTLCKRELPRTTQSYELLVQRHMNRIYTLVYRVVCNDAVDKGIDSVHMALD